MPWEGWADGYRDSAFHGGIFSLYFIANWYATQTAHHLLGEPQSYNPDACRNERLFHTGTHYHAFYTEEGRMDQLRWFDYWLKDMDIFATIRNIGRDGKDVWEVGQQGQPVPVAKGWLRASHRKLDPKLSLPYRPYHTHDERWWLTPGKPVECGIEIWPACMVFKKGHRVRLDIQPRDGVGSAPYTHYHADYSTGGYNTVHTGGSMASYLMLPIVPPRSLSDLGRTNSWNGERGEERGDV